MMRFATWAVLRAFLMAVSHKTKVSPISKVPAWAVPSRLRSSGQAKDEKRP